MDDRHAQTSQTKLHRPGQGIDQNEQDVALCDREAQHQAEHFRNRPGRL